MKKLFDPCINRTLELIDGQIASILRNGKTKPKVGFYRHRNKFARWRHLDGHCCGRIWSKCLFVQENHRILQWTRHSSSKTSIHVSWSIKLAHVLELTSDRWSAVARGAVCRGLEGPQSGLVAVRLARRHYGTPISKQFNPRIHNPADEYTDPLTGTRYAKGQMSWLVEKGERLQEAKPKKVSIECSCKFKPR
jgi:hypothetical protein